MKAFAKANIFLKLIGTDKRGYHLLESRFILLENLFDELSFTNHKTKEGFEIQSDFKEETIITRAYNLLCQKGYKEELEEFFKNKSLKLIKNIPIGGGLGGGSSDGACFLQMINEELNLKISKQKLLKFSVELGSDLAFFISGFKSANVSGCGEILEEFQDEIPEFEFYFPDVMCQSKAVYEEFDKTNFDFNTNLKQALIYKKLNTKELLKYKNIELNDLFTPCINLYPKMRVFLEKNLFLSGSGSSVFKVL